jgi:hypothetical protein
MLASALAAGRKCHEQVLIEDGASKSGEASNHVAKTLGQGRKNILADALGGLKGLGLSEGNTVR